MDFFNILNNKMKILTISRGVPTNQDPQWGNFEYDQALALKNMGHEVIIVSLDGRFRLFRRRRTVICSKVKVFR